MSSRKARTTRILFLIAAIELCLLITLTQAQIGTPKVDPTVLVVGPYDVHTAIADIYASKTATVCPECVLTTPVPEGMIIVTATAYPTETPIPLIPNDAITVW